MLPSLDMDILRTLVLAEQLGGFGHAAQRIGRSQSAVSQQVRKIEERVGGALFRKQGRGLVPTAAGETLLAYARRILDLNDEALVAINGLTTGGSVRLGVAVDFADSWLPQVLGQFNRAHPAVQLEAVVDRNRVLVDRLDRGDLDLVLAIGQSHRFDARLLGWMEAIWIGADDIDARRTPGEPVALVLSDPPCFFRARALATLEQARLPWRVALTSPSVHGLWAATAAGLGVTLRITIGMPNTLQRIGPAQGLPDPVGKPFSLSLHDGGRPMEPATRQLSEIIGNAISDRAAALSAPSGYRDIEMHHVFADAESLI